MRSELCLGLLNHLIGGLELETTTRSERAWLEEQNIPMRLKRFLQHYWSDINFEIADLKFYSVRSIREESTTIDLLARGYLMLGRAGNGDRLVLRLANELLTPGFASWEEDTSDTAGPFFVPIARSFESLLYRLAEEKFIPYDYYIALDYYEFLKEEGDSWLNKIVL